MKNIVKPTQGYDYVFDNDLPSVFLAGSIDNGAAENWQGWAEKQIEEVTIFNPRVNWWNPEASDKDIETQILWELDHLDSADIVALFFADTSKAPISFLEMGLHLKNKPVIIYCNPKFYRYVNVKVTAKRYGVEIYEDKDQWMNRLKAVIEDYRIIE